MSYLFTYLTHTILLPSCIFLRSGVFISLIRYMYLPWTGKRVDSLDQLFIIHYSCVWPVALVVIARNMIIT